MVGRLLEGNTSGQETGGLSIPSKTATKKMKLGSF